MIRGRLFPPQSVSMEQREVVRCRKWRVTSLPDVSAVVELLNREKAVGCLTVDLGPGGVPQSMSFEQRSKLPA